ncbi:hypothetical protein ACLM5H_03150 [Fredinandcohnia humi]
MMISVLEMDNDTLQESNWGRIVDFLEEQENLIYKCLTSTISMEHRYDCLYNNLKQYIEEGITIGEFAPEYSVDLIINSTISSLEGIRSMSKYISHDRLLVNKQIKLLKENLRDTLVVL